MTAREDSFVRIVRVTASRRALRHLCGVALGVVFGCADEAVIVLVNGLPENPPLRYVPALRVIGARWGG